MLTLTCDDCGLVRAIHSAQHVRRHAEGNVCRKCAKKRMQERTGTARHPFAELLNRIKQKCYNPNNDMYPHTGAKGITVCEEWLNDRHAFFKFLEDLNYDRKIHRIVRIDKTGPFSPENCTVVLKKGAENDQRTNTAVRESESIAAG